MLENYPDKSEATTGCVRETLQINMKPSRHVSEKLCKRNSPDKNQSSMGYVRETQGMYKRNDLDKK